MSESPAETDAVHRAQLSCATCRRRKVRCDKRTPCTPCARGGHECVYRPSEPRARRARKTTMNDVALRISELEKTLIAVTPARGFEAPLPTDTPRSERSRQPSGSSAPGHASPGGEVLLGKGSSSQYFNEVLLSRVIEQEHDVRTALATPGSAEPPQLHVLSPFNPMGILSCPIAAQRVAGLHPAKLTAVNLWRTFVESVDTCIKIVHVPTTELLVYTVIDDPSNASMEALALCFAIYYASTVALGSADGCAADNWDASLQRYKTGMEQAMAHSDFLESPTVILLQAMAIFLSALRVHNTGRAVWILNGLAMRAAQSIGLHRDGKKLGLSPFESEIRRRLWWYFRGKDDRAAEDHGMDTTPCLAVLSDIPLNVDDEDLFPGMAELPPPKDGWTRLTLGLACIRIGRAYAELQQLYASQEPRYNAREQVMKDLRSAVDEMYKGCNPVIPSQRISLLTARFILRKLDFVTHQQWQAMKHPNEQELLATEESLLEAVNLLEEEERVRADELLRPFRWSMQSHPQFHLTFFILWHICVRPAGPSARRALRAVESYVDEMERTRKDLLRGSKWPILKALKTKASKMIPPEHGVDDGSEASGAMDQAGTSMAVGSISTGGFVEMIDAGMIDDMHCMPCWSTLVQDFLQDESNFSTLR